MARPDLIFRIAGESGEGVISTGDIIAHACARAGLEAITFNTFPAEVRGGYAMSQLRVSGQRLCHHGDGPDILCAFNRHAFEQNRQHLQPGATVIFDAEFNPADILPEGVHTYPLPMTYAAKKLGSRQVKNMVALGALSELFSIPPSYVRHALSARFAAKGEAILKINLAAFDEGRALAGGFEKSDPWRLPRTMAKRDVIMQTGNEAAGLGALIAGLDFFAAYPITPASGIAHYLARHLPKTGGTLIQAEDEIASISQVLGASWTGAKAMTATSGPGLSLMSEMLGMAFMSETPMVVVNVQRGGPSTGLPTKHEQSDLFAAVHGSHGDGARIVLAPASIADCLDMTVEAFNLAEAYQCPVIMLSDALLGLSSHTIDCPDPNAYDVTRRKCWNGKGEYRRYASGADGVSAIADPGTPNGLHIATGLEHDESGNPSYAPENHEAMSAKRFAKLKAVAKDFPPVEIDGDTDTAADLGVICWGSTTGAVREAIQRLREEGITVKGFYPRLMWPMQVDAYEHFAASCCKVLVAEVNHQGQLAHFIRAETSIEPISYTICCGMPFTPAMIVEKVRALI